MDDDNLSGAFKAVRDAIADWLGVDDGSDREKWRRHVFAELRKLHRRNAVNYGRRRGHHRTWTATEFGRLMLEQNKGDA